MILNTFWLSKYLGVIYWFSFLLTGIIWQSAANLARELPGKLGAEICQADELKKKTNFEKKSKLQGHHEATIMTPLCSLSWKKEHQLQWVSSFIEKNLWLAPWINWIWNPLPSTDEDSFSCPCVANLTHQCYFHRQRILIGNLKNLWSGGLMKRSLRRTQIWYCIVCHPLLKNSHLWLIWLSCHRDLFRKSECGNCDPW